MSRVLAVIRWAIGVLAVFVVLWAMMSLYGNRPLFARHAGESPWPPGHLPIGSLIPAPSRLGVSLTLVIRRRAGDPDSGFLADMTVTNRAATAVKDLLISCDALDENGDATGRAGATLRGLFPPHTARTVSMVALGFMHHDVASARCAVVGYTPGG